MGIDGIENCIKAGIDTLEHAELFAMDEPKKIDQSIKRMIDQKTIIIPTLSNTFYNFIVEFGVKLTPSEDYLARKLMRQPWFADDPSHGPVEWYIINDVIDGFRLSYNAGIKITAGNDAGIAQEFPFDILPFELKLMILAEMKPMEALQAVTKNAAEALGIESMYRTLEAGKKADLIVLPRNPIEDIDVLYEIDSVYKLGLKIDTGNLAL